MTEVQSLVVIMVLICSRYAESDQSIVVDFEKLLQELQEVNTLHSEVKFLKDLQGKSKMAQVRCIPYTPDQVFEDWLEMFENFLELTEINDDGKKIRHLVNNLGECAIKLIRICKPQKPTELAYKNVLEKCSKVFSPKLEKISSKSKFFAATQVRGESLTDYAVRLKTLALRCGFGANMKKGNAYKRIFVYTCVILNTNH